MVGSPATAMEALDPQGHVLVEGEIWQAVAKAPVAKGHKLRVTGHDHLMLQVEPEGAHK
jgi:membrane-bound serine protease (ClpP class)